MFETMALPHQDPLQALLQPQRDPLQAPATVLRGKRYALALDDQTMALPQPAA